MGNQPSRKNIPGKGGKYRHTRKMVNNTRKSTSSKKYNKAAKIALGAGLKDSGKSFLSAAVLASAAAYRVSKKKGFAVDAHVVANKAINNVIKKEGFDVTKQGRTILKSGINSVISSWRKK